MKNKILLVAKKEWYRFFTDRRMVVSALIFPCIFLYIVFAFLVPFIVEISGNDEDAVVYAVNPEDYIIEIFKQIPLELTVIEENEKEAVMEGIAQNDGNFLVVFPENFIEAAYLYDVMLAEESEKPAPEVLIYYNSLAANYSELYSKILTGLSIFEKSIAKKFDINLTDNGDLAQAGSAERLFLSLILPVFLLLFIFQGAMATTTEAITGEKERGTLATIFLTSITPIELSLGKILGLGFQAFLCGVSASLGLIFSLPKFIDSFTAMFSSMQMQNMEFSLQIKESLSQYGINEIFLLILTLFVTACFIVTLIAIIAINARTAKEAQLLAYPMMIVLLFASFITSFNSSGNTSIYIYLIPICNSIQNLNDLINRTWNSINMTAVLGSNILLSGIGCFFLSHLLKTEKIIGA